jgi:hypothetical protein
MHRHRAPGTRTASAHLPRVGCGVRLSLRVDQDLVVLYPRSPWRAAPYRVRLRARVRYGFSP